MRVVLFSGKGGVGKTSLAVATALRAAHFGHRVALVSSDPAHSLGDALACRIGPQLVEVAPGVEALEVSVLAELERTWEKVHRWLRQLLLSEEGVAAEEVLVLPGFEELVALRAIGELSRASRHDLCVVDCAPTAATLRMLRLPEVVDLLMERLWERGTARALRRLAAPLGAGRLLPPEEAFDAFETLVSEVSGVRELLLDPQRTRARLVTQPAQVVIQETRRTWSYLCLHGIATDALLINRVLPDHAGGARLAVHRAQQDRALLEIEQSFPLPTLRAPLCSREPRGVEALAQLGEALYAERDPAAPLCDDQPLRLTSRRDGTELSLHLPHAAPDAVEVERHGAMLEVHWGLASRRVALPDSVAACELQSAQLEAERLTIRFASPEGA